MFSIEVHLPGVKTHIHLPKGRLDLSPTHLGTNTYLSFDLPEDYEECGTCGYDHDYSPFEANASHLREEQESRNEGVDEAAKDIMNLDS
jgi:hypothetical protein